MEHVVLFPLPFPSFSSSSSSSSSSSISVSVFWLFFFFWWPATAPSAPLKRFFCFQRGARKRAQPNMKPTNGQKPNKTKPTKNEMPSIRRTLATFLGVTFSATRANYWAIKCPAQIRPPKRIFFFLVQRKKQRRYDPLANPEPPSSFVSAIRPIKI